MLEMAAGVLTKRILLYALLLIIVGGDSETNLKLFRPQGPSYIFLRNTDSFTTAGITAYVNLFVYCYTKVEE